MAIIAVVRFSSKFHQKFEMNLQCSNSQHIKLESFLGQLLQNAHWTSSVGPKTYNLYRLKAFGSQSGGIPRGAPFLPGIFFTQLRKTNQIITRKQLSLPDLYNSTAIYDKCNYIGTKSVNKSAKQDIQTVEEIEKHKTDLAFNFNYI